MTRKSVFIAGTIAALSMGLQAEAGPVYFEFSGGGFSGSGTLTITPDTAPTYCEKSAPSDCRNDPVGAYAITGISGTFSDSTDGISNAAITGLVPINPADERDPTFDPLVPASLSFVDYGTGASAGSFSYDNLFFPGGNPLDCSISSPPLPFNGKGTLLDVFGMAFTIAGGDSVDIWGDGNWGGRYVYGAEVTDGTQELGSTFNGVSFGVPEPGSASILAAGMLLLFAFTGGGAIRSRRGRVG